MSRVPRFCGCGCGGVIQIQPWHRNRGIPTFLQHHENYSGLDVWIEQNRNKHFCACGCGETFVPTAQHRRDGFPRFRRGHAGRVAHPVTTNVAAWVREQQGKHHCACGCGRPIKIYPTYRWDGIPRFRRECLLRLRVLDNHPNWKPDRSAVVYRSGRYFPPSIRRQIFERDGHRCRRCGTHTDLVADHVVPVSEGGDGSARNGQVLCHRCHAAKSRVERARRRSKSVEVMPCP